MSRWTLERYAKICRDCRADADSEYADSLDDSMLWHDMAQCLLDNEEGLEKFIKERIGAGDAKGCLADDLAFPGNCVSYILRAAKRKK